MGIFKPGVILFVALFATMKGNAQAAKGKFSIELSTGAAVPVDKFGKKTLSYHPDSIYGLAKTGLIVNLKAGYHVTERLSLSLVVSGLFNKEDKESFASNGFNTPGAWSSITVHSWKTFNLMVGPDYSFSLGNKAHALLFIPSVHIGMMKTSFPGDSAVYHSDRSGPPTESVMAVWRDKFPMRWALCYQASAGFEYPLSNNWHLAGALDLLNAADLRSAKYDNDTRRFKVSTLNIRVGIGVTF